MSDRRKGDRRKKNIDSTEERRKADRRIVKRRNYLINKRFQLAWLGEVIAVCICAMLLALATWTSIYFFINMPPTEEGGGFSVILIVGLALAYLAGFGILVYSGIILTHRTAGPMYHFTRIFEEIEKGNLDARIHLRKKDFWKETAAAFNKAMDAVQERMKG